MTNVRPGLQRSLAMVGMIMGATMLVGPAYAGSCPADKMRPDGSGQKMNPTPGTGVSDSVLTSIDLAQEPAMVKDRLLRLRRLEIQPGGVGAVVCRQHQAMAMRQLPHIDFDG